MRNVCDLDVHKDNVFVCIDKENGEKIQFKTDLHCLWATFIEDMYAKNARQNTFLNVNYLLADISWLNSCIAVLFISYSQAVDISFVRRLLAVKCIYACYQMYLCLLSNVSMLAIKCRFACCKMKFYFNKSF